MDGARGIGGGPRLGLRRGAEPGGDLGGLRGALVAKTMLAEDEAEKERLGALPRRALAQAKTAANPERLTPAQIDGLTMSSGKTYLRDARKGPKERANLDKVAEDCCGCWLKWGGDGGAQSNVFCLQIDLITSQLK